MNRLRKTLGLMPYPDFRVMSITRLEAQKGRRTLRCEAARPAISPFMDKQDKQNESASSLSAILSWRNRCLPQRPLYQSWLGN
jgi:hypothetical protein